MSEVSRPDHAALMRAKWQDPAYRKRIASIRNGLKTRPKAELARLRVQVAQLWPTSLSATEIGKRLGVSKNVVIGIVRRANLPHRESPIKPLDPEVIEQRKAAAEARRAERKQQRTARSRKSRGTGEQSPIRDEGFEFRKAWYEKVLGLNGKACQFPTGHPNEPDFKMCGERAVNGRPYCPHHCATSYVWSQFRPKVQA